jgi:hypothetical protein
MFQPILPQPWRRLRLASFRATKNALAGNSRRHDSDFNLEAEPDPNPESDLSSADGILIPQYSLPTDEPRGNSLSTSGHHNSHHSRSLSGDSLIPFSPVLSPDPRVLSSRSRLEGQTPFLAAALHHAWPVSSRPRSSMPPCRTGAPSLARARAPRTLGVAR